MKNESKTPRNVCVPRLLKRAGGKKTVKVVIPHESWDPVWATSFQWEKWVVEVASCLG